MIDEKTYKQYRRELSTAQWKYIFDRKYISFNPRTRETLVKKGFTLEHIDRIILHSNGIKKYGSEFTKKTHDMVEYICKLRENKLKEDHPNAKIIRTDEELLKCFSESILIGEEPYIYVYRGREAIVQEVSDEYILSTYYRWQIEIDKTAGKFLVYDYISGHKGSYGYRYKQ